MTLLSNRQKKNYLMSVMRVRFNLVANNIYFHLRNALTKTNALCGIKSKKDASHLDFYNNPDEPKDFQAL